MNIQRRLNEYRRRSKHLDYLRIRIEALEERAEFLRSSLQINTDTTLEGRPVIAPHGQRDIKNNENKMIDLVAVVEEYKQKQKELQDLRRQLESLIDSVCTSEEATVIKCKYLDLMRISEIAKYNNYSDRHVLRLIDRGMVRLVDKR